MLSVSCEHAGPSARCLTSVILCCPRIAKLTQSVNSQSGFISLPSCAQDLVLDTLSPHRRENKCCICACIYLSSQEVLCIVTSVQGCMLDRKHSTVSIQSCAVCKVPFEEKAIC